MAGAAGCWKQLWQDESGQDLVEYGLIVCVLGLGSVATLKSVAGYVAVVFTAVGTTLTNAL